MLYILFNLMLLSSCMETSYKLQALQSDSTISKDQIVQKSDTDSASASKVAVDFYKWYAEAIRLKKHDELLPAFVKDSNGMTALDMSNYSNSLRKNKFSKNLIDITTGRFKTCSDKLKDIPYDSLKTFEQSDYENIFCDFSSFYQWTNDTEPIDGADVIGFSQYKNEIVLKMSFYNIYDHKKSYWDQKYVEVFLTKTNDQWLIDNMQIVFNY